MMYYVLSLRSRNSDLAFVTGNMRLGYTNFLEQAKMFTDLEIESNPSYNDGANFLALSYEELDACFIKHTVFERNADTIIELIGRRIKPN